MPTSSSPRPHDVCLTRQVSDLEELLESPTGRRKGILEGNRCEPWKFKHSMW